MSLVSLSQFCGDFLLLLTLNHDEDIHDDVRDPNGEAEGADVGDEACEWIRIRMSRHEVNLGFLDVQGLTKICTRGEKVVLLMAAAAAAVVAVVVVVVMVDGECEVFCECGICARQRGDWLVELTAEAAEPRRIESIQSGVCASLKQAVFTLQVVCGLIATR